MEHLYLTMNQKKVLNLAFAPGRVQHVVIFKNWVKSVRKNTNIETPSRILSLFYIRSTNILNDALSPWGADFSANWEKTAQIFLNLLSVQKLKKFVFPPPQTFACIFGGLNQFFSQENVTKLLRWRQNTTEGADTNIFNGRQLILQPRSWKTQTLGFWCTIQDAN